MIKITVDYEDGTFRLMANRAGMSATPAGHRLYRGGDFPRVDYVHDSPESAAKDAEKLNAYLQERAGARTKAKRTEA